MTELQKKIKDMLNSRMPDMVNLGKTLQEEEKIKEKLNLELARKIQKSHPEMVIGGSLALFLHGIRLSRWKTSAPSDLDLVLPYYTHIEDSDFIVDKSKSDSKDFDMIVVVDNSTIDIKIDPKRRYESVIYEDITYFVSPLEVIWEAKCRYAALGNSKHRDDLLELCGKPVKKPMTTQNLDEIFDIGS